MPTAKLLKPKLSHNKLRALPFIAGATVIGVTILVWAFAAGSNTGFEAEDGTLANVQVINNSAASGGKAVQFSSINVPKTWQSGASGKGVPSGEFGTWRGSSVNIAGTWSDNNTAQIELWGIQNGAEYGNWTGPIDIAIGAIDWNENWGAAASGAYDARWTKSLTNLKRVWTSKNRGTAYIRFAHEFNGSWYSWSVNQANISNFKTAWQRFHALKQSIYPEAKLVFSTNANTAGQNYDWRTTWPGDNYVDVYSTDWYSNHWQMAKSNPLDGYGAPVGLEQHRQFAATHGKPFAVTEWGNSTDAGDQPLYMQYMYDFFTKNGGTGTGKVLYEIYFNVIWTPNKFGIFPENQTLSPNASTRYKQLF